MLENDIDHATLSINTAVLESSYVPNLVALGPNIFLLNDAGVNVIEVFVRLAASSLVIKSATNCNLPPFSSVVLLNVNALPALVHSSTSCPFNHNSRVSTHELVVIVNGSTFIVSANSNVHSATTTSSFPRGAEIFPNFLLVNFTCVPKNTYSATAAHVAVNLADVFVSVADTPVKLNLTACQN
jgi:hypothetical protein